jgi:hypothetical protein
MNRVDSKQSFMIGSKRYILRILEIYVPFTGEPAECRNPRGNHFECHRICEVTLNFRDSDIVRVESLPDLYRTPD